MKRILLMAAGLLLSVSAASAATTTQKWTLGWDNFSEPLDLTHSKITWSVSATRKLTVTFTLKGATPSKLYQVSINFFCSTFPATFGQFPTERNADGSCIQLTRQLYLQPPRRSRSALSQPIFTATGCSKLSSARFHRVPMRWSSLHAMVPAAI